MTTERTCSVGLSHPTVVPGGDESDREGASAGPDDERCPECGRPVAARDRTDR